MKSKAITYWLKAVTIFIALLGLAFFGGAKAYELSDKSASKSASSTESSMPIFVIIAVIILIAIFLVGYVRNNKDDEYDDY